MGLIRFAIDNPVKVAVAVIMVVLFGLLNVMRVPIQLTPDVDKPVITVTTVWPGASPQEVESELVDRQEEKLKSVENLLKMRSSASEGQAKIKLEFPVGIDKNVALRDVSDKLRQVPDYPDRVEEPVVSATDDEHEGTIAWLVIHTMDDAKEDLDVTHLKTFIEDKVKPQLERAPGIAGVNVYGGLDREIQVIVDPYRMAARKITFGELRAALVGQNANISAGTITAAKRDYTFRTVGEYRSVEEIAETVVAYKAGGPVFVRDIAEVVDGFRKQYAFVRSLGEYVLALPVFKETGSNVIQAMDALKEKMKQVNEQTLNPMGLQIDQVYDQTTYIWSSIYLVIENIFIGGALAVIVLLVFLRSGSATGIVAAAIPISVAGTFLVIALTQRPFNVIMLAGMAFAVGMVVDNAIVVLENIFRHRSMGKSKSQAALDGASEVWGAVLASTLTTIAVFLPVIFIQEEAGQLFRDIAIAISAAVGFSLVVSVLVIPPMSARFFQASHVADGNGEKPWVLARFGSALVSRVNKSVTARLVVVGALTAASFIGSWLLAPEPEYLPAGNQNMVFGMLFSPPGYSVAEFRRMAVLVEDGDPEVPNDGIRPFWEAEVDSDLIKSIPPVDIPVGVDGEVRSVQAAPIRDFFFVAYGGIAFMGCSSKEETNVKPLEFAMIREGARLPGVFTFFQQMSIFQSGDGSGSSVDIEVRGEHQEAVTSSALAIMGEILQQGYGYPQPDPSNFHLGRPEVQIRPKRTQAADLGFTARDVGFVTESIVRGGYAGEYNDRGDKIDLVIKVKGTENADQRVFAQVPVCTPSGDVVPVASIVDMTSTTAPQQINHIEEMNSVTLKVSPKVGVPLSQTMRQVEEEIVEPLRARGAIADDVMTNMAGAADKLTQTMNALLGDFSGKVTRPRFVGGSVLLTMLLIIAVVVALVVCVRVFVSPKLAVRLFIALPALLVIGFFAANPAFALALVQSRMVLALVVTYLLMAALFESYVYPFVIMFSVPLAAVGGFAALQVVHQVSLYDVTSPIQQLDVLTMLGFVILIGIVVNNAILLVHQALNNMRDHGMNHNDAIVKSVLTRTRPIFMSALTSVFGMLPLVIMPGAGSELYRGLGSVVLGGLLVSTIFTLLVVPVVFSLFIEARMWLTSGSASAIEHRETDS